MSDSKKSPKVSRRHFLKSFGTTAAVAATVQVNAVAKELEKHNAEKLHGPAAVPVSLNINDRKYSLEVEPRVTLLDVLRNHLSLTGAKEVCDRATCGACTVLLDGKPVYSCMKLAIDAQNHRITTVEGLSKGEELSQVQKAFIECDSLMCGYCTPGFLLSLTALLKQNPNPSEGEVRKACSGNLCRCGTYPRIIEAALKVAGAEKKSSAEVIRLSNFKVTS